MKRKTGDIVAVRTSRPQTKPQPNETSQFLKEAETARDLKRAWIAIGSLCLLIGLCYANGLWNGFVFDDHLHIMDHRILRNLANLPRMIYDYRPLRDVSYAIDFSIWGDKPFGFHLTNLLIHLSNSVLLYWLIYRWTGKVWTALLATAIFALHPIQGDSVTYASGRRDVLFSFFYLASFHAYLKYDRSRDDRGGRSGRWLALFVGFWVLGLLSKEMAATLPLFIFVWSLSGFYEAGSEVSLNTGLNTELKRFGSAASRAFSKDRWLYTALLPLLALFMFYAVIIRGGSNRAGYGGFNYWGGSFFSNCLTVVHVHAWYLKQLVLPTPIGQYSGGFAISTSLLDWRVLLSIAVVGGVLVLGLGLLSRNRLMAFAILSYFILLLPVSHLIPHHELLADHNLYLPLMSFGLFAALMVEKVAAKGEWAGYLSYGAAALWIGVLFVMTIVGNRTWQDDYTFWLSNYNAVPNSIRAVYSYAGQVVGRNPRKAEELYEKCIALDPTFAPAYTEYMAITQDRKGAVHLEALIRNGLGYSDTEISRKEMANPADYRSQMTVALALARDQQGDHEGAKNLLSQAIEIYRSNPQPYDLLAGYYRGKNPEKEADILKQEIAWCPNSIDARVNYINLLVKAEKYDEAIPILNAMVTADSRDVFANYQLAQIYRTKMDCTKAWAYLNAAKDAAARKEDMADVQKAIPVLERQCGKRP